VERIWNADYYLNYGQTESFGVIGVECSEKNGYHRNELNFLFEIADPGPSGQGELVYTTLTREVMPLIRYRSSDITSLIDEPCRCGLFIGRIAKIVGRCDEMIVCGMGNISPWVFSEILRDVPTVTDEWQVRVWQEDYRDVVELRVETEPTNNGHTPHSVEQDIRQNLARLFPDFWKNLQMKLFDFRVTTTRRLSLRTERKLRRIVSLASPPVEEIDSPVHSVRKSDAFTR
jgi:phenylacetate-CoA ligase